MRYYKPPKLGDDNTWVGIQQVVLPQYLRIPVLELAHEGFGGHLGIRKTYLKLLNEFYWPKMKKDVTNYINSCHLCQVVGKPNQAIPSYP